MSEFYQFTINGSLVLPEPNSKLFDQIKEQFLGGEKFPGMNCQESPLKVCSTQFTNSLGIQETMTLVEEPRDGYISVRYLHSTPCPGGGSFFSSYREPIKAGLRMGTIKLLDTNRDGFKDLVVSLEKSDDHSLAGFLVYQGAESIPSCIRKAGSKEGQTAPSGKEAKALNPTGDSLSSEAKTSDRISHLFIPENIWIGSAGRIFMNGHPLGQAEVGGNWEFLYSPKTDLAGILHVANGLEGMSSDDGVFLYSLIGGGIAAHLSTGVLSIWSGFGYNFIFEDNPKESKSGPFWKGGINYDSPPIHLLVPLSVGLSFFSEVGMGKGNSGSIGFGPRVNFILPQ